jgi:hypothetical protein
MSAGRCVVDGDERFIVTILFVLTIVAHLATVTGIVAKDSVAGFTLGHDFCVGGHNVGVRGLQCGTFLVEKKRNVFVRKAVHVFNVFQHETCSPPAIASPVLGATRISTAPFFLAHPQRWAVAHVAGVAALVLQSFPAMRPAELKLKPQNSPNRIPSTAFPKTTG